MKKLITALSIFTAITLYSCSSDDSSANCAVCTYNEGDSSFSESVCQGGNGNAYVQDVDTGIGYDEYIMTAEEGGAECN